MLGTAPGDGADIGIGEAAGGEDLPAGGVDLLGGIGDFEAEDAAGLEQAFGMIVQTEDVAAISPFAFEHGAGIMQAMRENMQPGFTPGDEGSVQPDEAVAVIERNRRHGSAPCNIVA